jgi:hypothetical protein
MKTIIIAPYAKRLKTNKENPKNYPYWPGLVAMLRETCNVVQIAVTGEAVIPGVSKVAIDLKMREIESMTQSCDTWVSVDSFLQHMVNCCGKKPGTVIWSLSDPSIFGYGYNLNVLKDRARLKRFQFGIWEECEYDADAYMPADAVYALMRSRFGV